MFNILCVPIWVLGGEGLLDKGLRCEGLLLDGPLETSLAPKFEILCFFKRNNFKNISKRNSKKLQNNLKKIKKITKKLKKNQKNYQRKKN